MKAKLSLKDLRSFEELSREVDKKMSSMGLAEDKRGPAEESSSSENSLDDEFVELSQKKLRGKKKSGKTAKVTSRVLNPQIWPQSELSLSLVNKEVQYDDLTVEAALSWAATRSPLKASTWIRSGERAPRRCSSAGITSEGIANSPRIISHPLKEKESGFATFARFARSRIKQKSSIRNSLQIARTSRVSPRRRD